MLISVQALSRESRLTLSKRESARLSAQAHQAEGNRLACGLLKSALEGGQGHFRLRLAYSITRNMANWSKHLDGKAQFLYLATQARGLSGCSRAYTPLPCQLTYERLL